MKHSLFLLVLIAVFSLPFTAQAQDRQSVYDRVMESGKIRCGYAVAPPYISLDVNTGEMGGMMYEYVEQMAENLGLEVDWTEEVGWGDYITALQSRRIDAFCVGATRIASRALHVDFLSPVMFMRADIFIRADDNRFEEDTRLLNDPEITFVVMEGDIYEKIMRRDFPEAQFLTLTQMTQGSDLMMSIHSGKADATITEVLWTKTYTDSNPGQIRRLTIDDPYDVSPFAISVLAGEDRFRRMLENATMEMIDNGTIDQIIDKVDAEGTYIMRPARPYRVGH